MPSSMAQVLSVTGAGAARAAGGRGTRRAAPTASRPATAEKAKAVVYAPSVGRPPAPVEPARIAVAIAAPNDPPTVRMTVLIPVAMPTSDGGAAATRRSATAENGNEMPARGGAPAAR